MYLDNYSGSHTGKLLKIGTYTTPASGEFIKLEVEFEDGYNRGGNHPNELVIQEARPLGRRLAAIDLGDYLNKIITIKHIENSVLVFYLNEKENAIPIAVISQEINDWEDPEIEELWKCYQLGCSTEHLARIFGRHETEQIIPQINNLIKNRVNNTPIDPKGLKDFLSPTNSFSYVVGASTDAKIGEWLSSESEGKLTGEESLFKIVDQVVVDDGRSFQSDFFFTVNCKTSEIKMASGSIEFTDEEFEKLQQSLVDEALFLKANINRLNKEICYVWIRAEDFDKTGRFHSYFYVMSENKEAISPFKERSSEFLRYIMYLKSQLSYEYNLSLKKQEQEIKHQAVKSAIAFIMSRNMSHNLGSHFLYYTKADLWSASNLPEFSSSYLRGASKALDYIQGRMNYIAAVTSDDKIPHVSVNFWNQIYNNLVIDEVSKSMAGEDKSKYITNFLLKNLVRSEKYTRSELNSNDRLRKGIIDIKLSIWDEDDKRYKNIDRNDHKIEELLRTYYNLDLAMPGGLIGVQAFNNIIENFIRNSAKYNWGKIPKRDNLTITILLKKETQQRLRITIKDNKANALEVEEGRTLLEFMTGQLEGVKIIEDNFAINQENKGLKEMLLSVLWLNSNAYHQSFSEIIQDYHVGTVEERRNILDKYGFRFVSVPIPGVQTQNLGIEFTLPIFVPLTDIEIPSKSQALSDIVRFKPTPNQELSKILLTCFPRAVFGKLFEELPSYYILEPTTSYMYDNTCALSTAIKNNLENINDYTLVVNEPEPVKDFPSSDKIIHFETHINIDGITAETLSDYYNNYAYVDTISGENYTKVLEDMFNKGLREDEKGVLKYIGWVDKYLSLKIKESAMTRITIIDERLFDDVSWKKLPSEGKLKIKGTNIELSLKNIRVLNYFKKGQSPRPHVNASEVKGFSGLYGNNFRPFGHLKDSTNATDFLSIHVSLIEKMLKDHNFLEVDVCGPMGKNPLSPDRVAKFMEHLSKVFSQENGKSVKICVHTGRGKLNEELESALEGYPMINFQTLGNAFHDSKFLLSQLFYNLVYNYNKLNALFR